MADPEVSAVPVKELEYINGFIIGKMPEVLPDHYQRVDFPIPLFACQRAENAACVLDEDHLYIHGIVIDPDYPEDGLEQIGLRLLRSKLDYQNIVDRLIGRFLIVHGSRTDGFSMQVDASAMRMVFFGPSTESAEYACSHLGLAKTAFGLCLKQNPLSFKGGYPGIDTPLKNLYRMPANQTLVLGSRLQRIFPISSIPKTTIEDAWALAMARARVAAKHLSSRYKLLFSLTAGLDSRCSLAVLDEETRKKSQFFTYFNGAPSQMIDCKLATVIAERLNLRHQTFDLHETMISANVLAAVRKNSFGSHGHKLAATYHDLFRGRPLHVRTNLLEITRAALYRPKSKLWPDGISTPKNAARYHVRNLSKDVEPENMADYVASFSHFFKAANTSMALSFISSWDLHYLEFRMGAWHGNVLLESDAAFDSFILFNSREIISGFYGVDEATRAQSTHLIEVVLKQAIPEIEDIPINPKTLGGSGTTSL